MKTRILPKTDWAISEIGLGCWGLGGQYGKVDQATALDTVRTALDQGINLFDTADTYGMEPGRSESVVGEALQGVRDQVYIASKVGNWGRRQGHPFSYTHPLHVIACCHASLYRLKTDVIDLYQCHIGHLEEPDVFLEAFETLVKDGKIRAYGISANSLEVLERFNRDGNCTICQLDYSLVHRAPEQGMLPYCLENNIGTLIRGPLAQGILTGKYGPDSVFTDDVRSRWNDGPAHETYLEKLRRCEVLTPLAAKYGWIATALMGVLDHPAVTSVIPGAKSPAQLLEQVKASGPIFSPEDKAVLDPA